MQLGIVSNCWGTQLAEGASLADLAAEGLRRGFVLAELRQGALGDCEREGLWPDADALARVAARLPRVRFNLAMSLAAFDAASIDPALWRAGVAGAMALAQGGPAHLRLVDLTPGPQAESAEAIDRAARGLAGLAAEMAARGGVLSVENAGQAWRFHLQVFRRARALLGGDGARLRLCYDAVNLLGAADRPAAAGAVRELAADELSMVHFKQRRGGRPVPGVEGGEIDWADQIAALTELGYAGPGLFEIPPQEKIWEALEKSRAYLVAAGLKREETV